MRVQSETFLQSVWIVTLERALLTLRIVQQLERKHNKIEVATKRLQEYYL